MDINHEIEQVAETMEKANKARESKVDMIKSTILKLGKEGLKKALPNLTGEQRTLLNEVLEDMKKSSASLEPLSDSTKVGDEAKNEKKPRQGERDEELADEAKKKGQAEVKHQGGNNAPEGWEGQVIKSKTEESKAKDKIMAMEEKEHGTKDPKKLVAAEKKEDEEKDEELADANSGRRPLAPGQAGLESAKNLAARTKQAQEIAAKFQEGQKAMDKSDGEGSLMCSKHECQSLKKCGCGMKKSEAENPEGKKEDAEVKKEPMMTLDEKKKMAKANLRKMMKTMQDRKMEKSVCVTKLAKSLEVSEEKIATVWDEIEKAYKMEAPAEAAQQSPVPSQMKDDEDGKVQESEDPSVPKYKDKSAKQTDGDKKPMSGKSPETADEAVNKAPAMKKSETFFAEEELMYIAKSEANPFASRAIGQNKHYKVDDFIALEHASKEARLKKSTFDYADESIEKGAFKRLEHKLEGEGKSKESAGAIAAAVGNKKYGKAAMERGAAEGKPVAKSQAESEAEAAQQANEVNRKQRENEKAAKEEVNQIKTDDKLNIIQDKAGPKMPFLKGKMKKSWVEGLIEKGLDMNESQAFVAQTNIRAEAEGAKLVKSFDDSDMDALFAEQDMFKADK